MGNPEVMDLNELDLSALDVSALVTFLRRTYNDDGALGPTDQLVVAHRSEARVRTMVAALRAITPEVQAILAEDVDTGVLTRLATNAWVTLEEPVQLRLAERWLAEELRTRVRPYYFGSVAQLRLARSGELTLDEVRSMLGMTPNHDVLVALLASVPARVGMRAMTINPHISDELFWEGSDMSTLVASEFLTGELASFFTLHDPNRAPAGVQELLRAHPDPGVERALVGSPSWSLTTSMRTRSLIGCSRGVNFLNTHAPEDRSSWNTLVTEWEGTVDELIAVCASFAPA